MKIHEYQAKQLFAAYGVPIPRGKMTGKASDARQAAFDLGTNVVVKAQVHAGGRGKGGGIRMAASPEEAEAHAADMIGSTLVTPQTGLEGRIVSYLLIEETLPIAKEFYLGLILDRATARVVVMASAAGGMDIEEVAATNPDAILKAPIDPATGLGSYQIRELAFGLGLTGDAIKQFGKILQSLTKLFYETDASLVEINPLIITDDGKLLALDAKINFDDNALFRHKQIAGLRDELEEEPLEVDASKHGLNYIKLDGTVGCMVNGAGLAMATMDIIKLAGGEPANFLDVGGGASAEQVREGFKIILGDPNVKAVLINIFGGILRNDRLANGVVEAHRALDLKIPIVIRMEGTNVELGRKILRESGLNFTVATDMADAARKVVALAQGAQ